MSLVEIARKLGDHPYNIGRPIYFDSGDEEYQPVQVHAKPVWEIGKSDLIKRIVAEKDPDKNGIAITYGGFLGIDIAAAHDAEGILMLDINPEQKHFWRAVVSLLKECPTHESFNQRFAFLEKSYSLREPGKKDPDEPYPTFTGDEATYQKVRHWALNDRMASTDMDVMDTQRHKALAGLLQQAGQPVKLIYLSNIPHFYSARDAGDAGNDSWTRKTHFYGGRVMPDDYGRLLANQKLLAGDDTMIVQSVYNQQSGQFHAHQSKLQDLTLPLSVSM